MRAFRIFSFTLLALGLIAIILVAIPSRNSFPLEPRDYSRSISADISTAQPPASVIAIDGQKFHSTYHQPYSETETYTGENTEALCKIESFDPALTDAPTHLKNKETSINIKTHIHYDESSWAQSLGSFGDVYAEMFKKNDEVFIKTQTKAFLVSAKSNFGVELMYLNNEVVCYPTVNAINSKYYGPITSFHHSSEDLNFETLFIRGHMDQGCLTLLDKRGDLHLAVFPSRLDAGLTYSLIRNSDYVKSEETSIVWLATPLAVPAEGAIIDLKDPVTECGGVSKAILLRDTPIWDWGGFVFPSP